MPELYPEQVEAIRKMKSGCILCGGVGSGKSRTAIGFYISDCGGKYKNGTSGEFKKMAEPRDLYIITTAKKTLL